MSQVDGTGFDGLVISDVFPPVHGGSGKWLWEIYRRQPAGRFLMLVGNQFGTDPTDENYPQPIVRAGLDMQYRGISKASSLRRYWQQIRLVGGLVRHKKPTIMYAARPLSEGLVARVVKTLTGVPYVCFVHGEDVNIATTSRELRFATEQVLKHAKFLIANSNFTKHLLTSEWGINETQICLMHPGVDAKALIAVSQPANSAAENEKLRLLTVGRLQERKGQDMVIRALPKLIDNFGNVEYVIAGGGEDRERLAELAESLGVSDAVRFEGAVDESRLAVLFNECDIFVLANRTVGKDVEGFGIVLLEAQAFGKPVVAGKSGGTSDTLLHGETGFLVDCTGPDEIARVIIEELGDPSKRKAMGTRGREFVSGQYDWEILSKQATEIFQNAICKR